MEMQSLLLWLLLDFLMAYWEDTCVSHSLSGELLGEAQKLVAPRPNTLTFMRALTT